jgi:hypothetical protein
VKRLNGFWACLGGGVAVGLLLLYLQPVMRPEDCPNYGGNGNASAFRNPNWDLYLPIVLFGWLVLVLLELVLLAADRNRTWGDVALRAGVTVSVTLVASCCFVLPLEVVCH